MLIIDDNMVRDIQSQLARINTEEKLIMKKGTKIICINDVFVDDPKNPFRPWEIKKPENGKKYTVREVVKTKYGNGVLLEEIKNRKFFFDDISSHREPIFNIKRFKVTK